MGNGNRGIDPLQIIYRGAVIILLAIAGFLSANIYNQVSCFPKEYVTLERYKGDMDNISKTLQDISHKLDRFIMRHNEDRKDDSN